MATQAANGAELVIPVADNWGAVRERAPIVGSDQVRRALRRRTGGKAEAIAVLVSERPEFRWQG